MTNRLVALGTALAWVGALHGVVNRRRLRRPGPAPGPARSVAVLVPARDEAAVIAACVGSIDSDVLVLDDGSVDGTAALARAAGATVLEGVPPPPGWLGKPWACAQLVAATSADVLIFIDADVRLEPGAVDAAVALLDAAGLDIVCPFPRQLAVSPGERLVQPLLQWSWLTTLPLRIAERSPRPSLTAACGQFVVVRRAALERAGGFAAVRDAVVDDLALVRAVKRGGGRGGVVDGSALASCRMYGSWTQLRDGHTRWLAEAFGSAPRAAAVVAVALLAYVVPPVAAVRGSRVGLLGYAGGVVSRVVAARASRSRALPDALAHPVSILAFGYLTAASVRGRRRGTLRWKGRPV